MPLAVSALGSLSFIAIICYTWTEDRSAEFQRGYQRDDHQEAGIHLLSSCRDRRRKPRMYSKNATCSKFSMQMQDINSEK